MSYDTCQSVRRSLPVCVCACVCAYRYACMCVCVCVCVCVYKHTDTHTKTNINTCIHTYRHTRTHTHQLDTPAHTYTSTHGYTHTSEVTNGDVLKKKALPDQGGHIEAEGVRSAHTGAHNLSDEGVVLFVQLLLLYACRWIHTQTAYTCIHT
jgi:hypothetical protein